MYFQSFSYFLIKHRIAIYDIPTSISELFLQLTAIGKMYNRALITSTPIIKSIIILHISYVTSEVDRYVVHVLRASFAPCAHPNRSFTDKIYQLGKADSLISMYNYNYHGAIINCDARGAPLHRSSRMIFQRSPGR